MKIEEIQHFLNKDQQQVDRNRLRRTKGSNIQQQYRDYQGCQSIKMARKQRFDFKKIRFINRFNEISILRMIVQQDLFLLTYKVIEFLLILILFGLINFFIRNKQWKHLRLSYNFNLQLMLANNKSFRLYNFYNFIFKYHLNQIFALSSQQIQFILKSFSRLIYYTYYLKYSNQDYLCIHHITKIMSTLQPSKIVYKNLQDIIKNSTITLSTTKSHPQNDGNNINDRLLQTSSQNNTALNKQQFTSQQSLKQSNKKKLNSSLSKHSLKSKQKINFTGGQQKYANLTIKNQVNSINKNSSNLSASQRNQNGFSTTKLFSQSQIDENIRVFYTDGQQPNQKYVISASSQLRSSKKKNSSLSLVSKNKCKKENLSNNNLINKKSIYIEEGDILNLLNFDRNRVGNHNHMKSMYFNQIDVIITELEDFIREIREKVVFNVTDNFQQNTEAIVNKLGKISETFKHQIGNIFSTTKCSNSYQNNNFCSSRPQQQSNSKKIINIPQQTSQSLSSSYKKQTSKPEIFIQQKQRQQLIRISEFMQRQNTINSTILSPQQGDQSYLHTQTDTELLSMLVYKNKVNNTKRKYQQYANTANNYVQNNQQHQIMLSSRSGRNSVLSRTNQRKQCEYSFRKKGDSRTKQSQLNVLSSSSFYKKQNIKQTPNSKKKCYNQHCFTEKAERSSSQKQNIKNFYGSGFSVTKNSSQSGLSSKINSGNCIKSFNHANSNNIKISTIAKKENKQIQKSIYQIVLEENKRLRNGR